MNKAQLNLTIKYLNTIKGSSYVASQIYLNFLNFTIEHVEYLLTMTMSTSYTYAVLSFDFTESM